MKKISTIIMTVFAVFTVALAPAMVGPSVSAAPKDELAQGANTGNTGGTTDIRTFIRNIINILLFVVGAVAVLMIVIGGLRYVTSGGDSSSVTAAKNTILYAVVGIIVAAAAYAIVNFVVTAL